MISFILNKLNKRRRRLLWKLLCNTRLNRDFLKYAANLYRSLTLNKESSVILHHPTSMMLELGNVCNLHCRMCPREYEYGKQMDVGFMPKEKAMSIIDEAYPYLTSIGLTGLGETLLHPHLLEIMQYIKQKKPAVIITISTNAHFNGYLEKMMPLLQYTDNIQFSVDGVGDIYEKMRPNTHFDNIKENIRATIKASQQYGCSFMINFVVTKTNYTDMCNVVRLADELNINSLNFNCVSVASMPNQPRSYYDFFKSEEYLSEVAKVKELAEQYPQIEVTGMCYPYQASFHNCNFPWEYPYITWDGYYVPCCGKPFPKLLNFGNVFEEGLMPVLNSKKAQAFRRLWQKNTAPSFCHNCQLVDF